MSFLRRLEKGIDHRLRELFGSPHGGRELVEIRRAILDEVAERVEPVSRGRRMFPFDQLTVRMMVADPQRRAAFQLVFVDERALENDIRERLREEGAEFEPDLTADVLLIDEEMPELAAKGYDIVYRRRERRQDPVRQDKARPLNAALTVLGGSTGISTYPIEKQRVNLGRQADVFDDQERLVRRNDLAFDDASEAANATISRAHAHIEYTAGEFRLCDDRSAQGTSVFRNGRLIRVPSGPRGIRLETGDEIYLGKVRLRFDIDTVQRG